jgi:hypothetical protein
MTNEKNLFETDSLEEIPEPDATAVARDVAAQKLVRALMTQQAEFSCHYPFALEPAIAKIRRFIADAEKKTHTDSDVDKDTNAESKDVPDGVDHDAVVQDSLTMALLGQRIVYKRDHPEASNLDDIFARSMALYPDKN